MSTNPQRIALLQKLTAARLVNTFTESDGNQGVLHQMNPVHTIVNHLRPILILSSRVRLCNPSGLLPTSCRTVLHYPLPPCLLGDRGSAVVKGTALKIRRSLVRSQMSWNPSDRTMALGSTQPLTQMSTTSISWG
jgi:hypothetical protein